MLAASRTPAATAAAAAAAGSLQLRKGSVAARRVPEMSMVALAGMLPNSS